MKIVKTNIGIRMVSLFILLILAGMGYALLHEGVKLSVWAYDKIFRAPVSNVYISSQSDSYFHDYRNCKELKGSDVKLSDYSVVFKNKLAACPYCGSNYDKEVISWIEYANKFLDGFLNLEYSWYKDASDSETFTLTLKSNGNSYVYTIIFNKNDDWTGRNDKQLSNTTITRYNNDYCRQLSILYELGYNYLKSRGVIAPDEWEQVKDDSTTFILDFMTGKKDLRTYHRFKSGGGGGIFATEAEDYVMMTFSTNG